MEEGKNSRLVGIESLEAYYGRCWNVIKKLIDNDNFPAIKNHGRWESDKDLIDKYNKRCIERKTTNGAAS